MTQFLQVAAIALATLGSGAATLTVMNKDIPDLVVPEGAWAPGTALDGQSFKITGTDLNSGAVLQDDIVFHDAPFNRWIVSNIATLAGRITRPM